MFWYVDAIVREFLAGQHPSIDEDGLSLHPRSSLHVKDILMILPGPHGLAS